MASDLRLNRMTDRARRVMALANQEAQRLNHAYVGTEHILLGMLKEGGGVAVLVLQSFGLDLNKVRQEVEKFIRQGPDLVTMGRLPQTPRAKKVIEYAIEEAREMNHNYLGTEHLLLGLLKEVDGMAATALLQLGVTLDKARGGVIKLLGVSPPEAVCPSQVHIHCLIEDIDPTTLNEQLGRSLALSLGASLEVWTAFKGKKIKCHIRCEGVDLANVEWPQPEVPKAEQTA